MELSTSKPFVATQLPTMNAWYLDVYQLYYYKDSAKSMQLRSEEDSEQATPRRLKCLQCKKSGLQFHFR
ncbi:MAG: hypothetical protein N3F66_07490 [Spirochaetes bacterium]|nr:hypothetical protein [Spirochaetota bacterium]